MLEAEDFGVKSLVPELLGQGSQLGIARRAAIERVAQDRGFPALGEVDADLMRPPRLETTLDEARPPLAQLANETDPSLRFFAA